MRTMYDSTNARDIPDGSQLVMGYVDGSYPWSDADFRRFPGRVVVRACIFNDRMDAQVLDVEPGNNDADGAVPWVRMKWARGETPTVYCFSDAGPRGFRVSDVREACDAAGVRRPLILIAKWDNDPSTFDPSGDAEIIGKQYANPELTGGHYDASIVADFWPGVDAPADAPLVYAGQSAAEVIAHVGSVVLLQGAWSERGLLLPATVERVRVGAGSRFFALFPLVDGVRRTDVDRPAMFIVTGVSL